MPSLNELHQQRNDAFEAMQAIHSACETEDRSFKDDEQRDFSELAAKVDDLKLQLSTSPMNNLNRKNAQLGKPSKNAKPLNRNQRRRIANWLSALIRLATAQPRNKFARLKNAASITCLRNIAI